MFAALELALHSITGQANSGVYFQVGIDNAHDKDLVNDVVFALQ
jgi:hypothetical protein